MKKILSVLIMITLFFSLEAFAKSELSELPTVMSLAEYEKTREEVLERINESAKQEKKQAVTVNEAVTVVQPTRNNDLKSLFKRSNTF